MLTAPFQLNELKSIITGTTKDVVIDYLNSKIKGATLLTYIYNLNLENVKIDLTVATYEQRVELFNDYLKHKTIVSIDSLNATLGVVLLKFRKADIWPNSMPGECILSFEEIDQYLSTEANIALVSKIASIMDSLILYGITKMSQWVESFPQEVIPKDIPVDETKDLGYTFTHLITMPMFSDQYFPTSKFENSKWFPFYFDSSIYKGRDIFTIVERGNYIFPMLTMMFANSERTLERLKLSEENYDPAPI